MLGHDFAGWNVEKNGSGASFTKYSRVERDMTVYAQWNYVGAINSYSVTFQANDGSGTYQTRQVIFPADTVGYPLPSPPSARPGCTFLGWHTWRGEFTAYTKVTSNTIVYAHWEGPVTLNSYEGNVTVRVSSGCGGSELTYADIWKNKYGQSQPSYHPVSNYYFTGWNTKEDGTGTPYSINDRAIPGIILYAQWRAPNPLYKVTFDLCVYTNTGANREGLTVYPGYGITIPQPYDMVYVAGGGHVPAAFMPDTDQINIYHAYGKKFIGWYTKPPPPGYTGWTVDVPVSGSVEFTESTPVTGDITVYGHWKDP
jgi:uncharacterized repeat protein (TIGR02543 family)